MWWSGRCASPAAPCSTAPPAYSYSFTNSIQVTCDRGVMVFDPSMEYHAHRLRIRDRVIQMSEIDQFAREMDHFCMAITDNLPIVADGAEGMQDVS